MDPNTLAIPIAFILLSTVLCLLLIGSKWKWWLKLLLIVSVPSFGLAVWTSIASYKGWPTTSELPRKALVLSGLVREPDPAGAEIGSIYLWVIPLDFQNGANPLDYRAPRGEPRSYKLPYSRQLHKAVERAMGMIRQGKPVVLDRSGQPHGQGGEGEPGDGQGQEGDGGPGGHRGYGYDPDRQDYQVYELPPPQPPQKVPEPDPTGLSQ